ncbi:MAG: hypothetical protein U0893_17460 [Chloroflexota bacterium]
MLLVAGLALTAPPSGPAGPDDHFGLILHPLFPHVHGDVLRATAEASVLDEAAAEDSTSRVSQVEQSPGISAGTSDAGGRDVVAGIVLPLSLAGLLLEIARRRLRVDLPPERRTLAPPLPPPRNALSVA